MSQKLTINLCQCQRALFD